MAGLAQAGCMPRRMKGITAGSILQEFAVKGVICVNIEVQPPGKFCGLRGGYYVTSALWLTRNLRAGNMTLIAGQVETVGIARVGGNFKFYILGSMGPQE